MIFRIKFYYFVYLDLQLRKKARKTEDNQFLVLSLNST